MKRLFGIYFLSLIVAGCGSNDEIEIYNESNTNVINGVVCDINENPINGIYKAYYSNGIVKMEMSARGGLPHGEGKFYDENGNLQYSGTFESGKINGKFYQYYDDGNIHNELNYINGLQDGTQILYDNKGQILAEVVYENGKAFSGYVVIDGEKIDLEEEYLNELIKVETIDEDIENFQERNDTEID